MEGSCSRRSSSFSSIISISLFVGLLISVDPLGSPGQPLTYGLGLGLWHGLGVGWLGLGLGLGVRVRVRVRARVRARARARLVVELGWS